MEPFTYKLCPLYHVKKIDVQVADGSVATILFRCVDHQETLESKAVPLRLVPGISSSPGPVPVVECPTRNSQDSTNAGASSGPKHQSWAL